MLNLKEKTAIRLQDLGVNQDITFSLFEKGLMDERTAKKFLIKDEYEQNNPAKGHKGDVKQELADKYCCSFETVNLYLKD